MILWSVRKNGLIRNVRLVSKFMTLQPGSKTVTVHTLPNISLNKNNQAIKIGQLIEYKKRKNFLQKSCRT